MAIEITTVALAKILTPILNSIAKECVIFAKNSHLKWSAADSVKKLSKTIIDINTVKTMWSRDKAVLIDEFYYSSKAIKKNSNKMPRDHHKISDGNIIIEGIVGQGKSILLRQLCNSTIEDGIIPIFIELRMISTTRSLIDLILDFLDASEIVGGKEIFLYLASNKKAALILDGFDEIPTSMILSTTYEIEQLRKKHDTLSIIISSRPYHAVQNLAGFSVYELEKLNENDHEPFLRKLIPDSVRRFNISQAITDAPASIKGVVTTPLMLTLLVLVYESEKEIPSTLPSFFDKLFNTVFSRHDKLKAGFSRVHYSSLSESKIQNLFDSFCFMLMQNGGDRSIKHDEFLSSFNKAIKYTPDSKCELEDFKKDIINVACLMLEDGFEQTTFLHKSIMEYHASSFIKSSSDDIASTFYNRAPDNFNNWESVLNFLSNIDSFRYGKHYVLQELPRELVEITSLLETKDKKNLIKYLDRMLPNTYAEMSGLSLSSFHTDTCRLHSFTLTIRQALLDDWRKELKAADSKIIHKAIRESPQSKKVAH